MSVSREGTLNTQSGAMPSFFSALFLGFASFSPIFPILPSCSILSLQHTDNKLYTELCETLRERSPAFHQPWKGLHAFIFRKKHRANRCLGLKPCVRGHEGARDTRKRSYITSPDSSFIVKKFTFRSIRLLFCSFPYQIFHLILQPTPPPTPASLSPCIHLSHPAFLAYTHLSWLLSLFLSPSFLPHHSNRRLAINSALVWPETLAELNMND